MMTNVSAALGQLSDAARRFPAILDSIESAAVTLTTVRLLAPHLTEANHRELLERARHKSKREVELLVATLNPRPDVPSTVRKLPAPVAPERYKIQITVSRQVYVKLRRAQDLLRHTAPNGDLAMIFERALELLVAHLERTRTGKSARPRAAPKANPKSRHIPAAMKRTVWQRDDGRCAFDGPHGRCTETGFLEYHHLVPFASGGQTSVTNLELRCRAHNQYEAELWFGATQRPLVREGRSFFGA